MQPAQQHGRRMPPESLEIPFLILMPRVSVFLPEVTQHIHSLRARGVVSFHVASARGADASAARRSAGMLCTVPTDIFLVFMQETLIFLRSLLVTVTHLDISLSRCKTPHIEFLR